MHKKTDEEKFLFKAYETAMSLKDPFHELEPLAIGKLLGQRQHKVKITMLHLSRAGFIKKTAPDLFILTQKAIDFVKNY